MVKTLVKQVARRCGFELNRFGPVHSHAAQLRSQLAHHGVNVVFDVGANVGQYGQELRSSAGYRGRIVSFEPMRAAHERLSIAAASDPLWDVAERAALGASAGTITLNIAANSVSSSVLPMLDSHARAAPQSRYDGSEVVPLIALDSVTPKYMGSSAVCFLKIDTQGFEREVLEGAQSTVAKAVGVQLELSLVPLYAGQALLAELLERMHALGFEIWGLAPTFADPRSGRILQVDATFFRN